jgi:hypothetical protein
MAQEKFGRVHSPVSRGPAIQPKFDRAVAMLHSFFFLETVKAFTAIAADDSTCAMAYWGIATSERRNPLIIPLPVANLKRGWEAVQKAKAAGPKTPREQVYVAAMETYYQDPENPDARRRVRRYEAAMEQAYLQDPGDPEAGID